MTIFVVFALRQYSVDRCRFDVNRISLHKAVVPMTFCQPIPHFLSPHRFIDVPGGSVVSRVAVEVEVVGSNPAREAVFVQVERPKKRARELAKTIRSKIDEH